MKSKDIDKGLEILEAIEYWNDQIIHCENMINVAKENITSLKKEYVLLNPNLNKQSEDIHLINHIEDLATVCGKGIDELHSSIFYDLVTCKDCKKIAGK